MSKKISIEPSRWQPDSPDEMIVYISVAGNSRQSIFKGPKIQCIMVATGFVSVGYELSITELKDREPANVEQGQVRRAEES